MKTHRKPNEKVQEGSDQEKAQSEKIPIFPIGGHSKNFQNYSNSHWLHVANRVTEEV